MKDQLAVSLSDSLSGTESMKKGSWLLGRQNPGYSAMLP